MRTVGAGAEALAAAPLPASSRTQEVNVAAAASIAIQRDLTNFNMWGVLFALTYPPEPPTFESPKVISLGVRARLTYLLLITIRSTGRRRQNIRPPATTAHGPSEKMKRRGRGDLAVNAPVEKKTDVAVTGDSMLN